MADNANPPSAPDSTQPPVGVETKGEVTSSTPTTTTITPTQDQATPNNTSLNTVEVQQETKQQAVKRPSSPLDGETQASSPLEGETRAKRMRSRRVRRTDAV